MKNEKETLELLALKTRFSGERDMIGWLCTVHKNKVHYPNNPEASARIQKQLSTASTLIALTYIFALLEEGGFDLDTKWILDADSLELKAWKHVRNTGAHAPGSRASGQRTAFNDFMTGDVKGQSGLKQNCEYTDGSIDLKNLSAHQFYSFAVSLIDKALDHCANDNLPA